LIKEVSEQAPHKERAPFVLQKNQNDEAAYRTNLRKSTKEIKNAKMIIEQEDYNDRSTSNFVQLINTQRSSSMVNIEKVSNSNNSSICGDKTPELKCAKIEEKKGTTDGLL